MLWTALHKAASGSFSPPCHRARPFRLRMQVIAAPMCTRYGYSFLDPDRFDDTDLELDPYCPANLIGPGYFATT